MDIRDAIALKGARLQIQIQEDTPMGAYHDALYFSPGEIDHLDEKAVTDVAKARVDNWVAFVTEQSSKPPVEPTKEELIAQQAEFQKQLDSLVGRVIANRDTAKADLQAISAQLKATAATIDSAASAKPAGEQNPR
jgi:hypothetical protein